MSRRKKNNNGRPRGNIRHYRGHTLHSDLELDVIKDLYSSRRKLKKAFNFGYETETLPYTIEGVYNPDFVLENKNTGKKIYVECKGFLDDQSKKKLLAVRRCYPDLDIRLLFEQNNKIRANSKMRYIDWAERNNFNASAVGRNIPVEWLIEIGEITIE